MPSKKDTSPTPAQESQTSSSTHITLTNEQFQSLLREIRESTRDSNSRSRESTPVSAFGETSTASFACCTVRFDGSKDSDVNAFIDHIVTYKDCMNISNANALRGLSILFEGLAAIWWQGIKDTVAEWNKAIELLKEVYSKKLPAHLIYREIFKQEQQGEESTEMFVCRIRALFAQLEYTLEETAQLDMVYGLLARKVRKRIPRTDIKTFNDLLRRSREIEQSIRETVVETAEQVSSGKTSSNKPRSRCGYCKNFGHFKDLWPKIKKKESMKDKQPTVQDTKFKPGNISCYGCGNPGFIRSNCPKCKSSSEEAGTVEFYTAMVSDKKPTRPLIAFTIRGAKGVSHLDTGASQSIAGYTLYQYLCNEGYEFTPVKKTITFADGIPIIEDLLTVDVVIDLEGRSIPLTFSVLP